jgi:hypothetical protein
LGLGGLLAARMTLRLLGCVSVLWQVAGVVCKGEFCAAQKFHKFRELGQ